MTLWINAFKRATGSIDDCLNAIRKDASPKAVEQKTGKANGAVLFSYRLREDSAKVPSLYAFVIGDRSHVQFGVYADREADVAIAHKIVESVRPAH